MVLKEFVDSSNINYIEYDEDKVVMRVEFKGGTLYEYSGVPKSVYNDIINAKLINKDGEQSVGGTFCKLVKNKNYPYRKLN